MSASLVRHRLDPWLIAFFVVAMLNGALLSLPESLGVAVSASSPWPPLRSLHQWAVTQEPAHLHIPPALQASLVYDGFVQTPALIVLVVGLVRLRRGLPVGSWLRPFGLVYAAVAVANMYFYFFQTFEGPWPPHHLGVYLPMNLPWLILPMLLAYRLWPRTQAARSSAT